MTQQTIALLIALSITLIVSAFCFFKIRKALRTGQISYSGNRAYMVARTYTRANEPFMFWAGIGVIVFVALLVVLSTVVFMLGVYGIDF